MPAVKNELASELPGHFEEQVRVLIRDQAGAIFLIYLFTFKRRLIMRSIPIMGLFLLLFLACGDASNPVESVEEDESVAPIIVEVSCQSEHVVELLEPSPPTPMPDIVGTWTRKEDDDYAVRRDTLRVAARRDSLSVSYTEHEYSFSTLTRWRDESGLNVQVYHYEGYLVLYWDHAQRRWEYHQRVYFDGRSYEDVTYGRERSRTYFDNLSDSENEDYWERPLILEGDMLLFHGQKLYREPTQ